MKTRQNIFAWFYEGGLHGLLELEKRYISFLWRFFSIGEMATTLFYPWHRDVTPKTWRGLHPVRALEVLADNIISRLLGAIIRCLVMISGLIMIFVALLLGLIVLISWVSFPLLTLALITLPSLHGELLLPALGLLAAYLLVIFWSYRKDSRLKMSELSYRELAVLPVFERIAARMGISSKNVPRELLESEELFSQYLRQYDLTYEDFKKIVGYECRIWDEKNVQNDFWSAENLEKIMPVGMQWRYGYTVNLDHYAVDLSVGDPTEYRDSKLVGREDEREIVSMLLQRPDQNCALLVGPAGIGKKTLIHSLGKQIRQGELGGYFAHKRLLLLDIGSAISDCLNKGEDVENMLRNIFTEAAYAGNIILVIEHIEHYLGKQENTFHPDISLVLSEYLSLASFQLIATSTPHEYHTLIEKQESIAKYFQVVELREPSHEETLEILLEKIRWYELGKILFTWQALETVIRDAEKYNWHDPMPERALDLAMEVLTAWQGKQDTEFITSETINEYLTLKTGVPQGELNAGERKKLLNLEESLHRYVIGQEEAVDQIAEALRRVRSGIGDDKKPIGSFLFLGPTGVGKTETAKALARAYFGDEKHMIRLDMSEYQNPSSVDRLIGNANLNQPGQLVIHAKENPYTLLLLDEVEKAYPSVLDLFLQILDEGFVTDAFGEKINFRSMIIIATSNAGAPLIKELVQRGEDAEDIKQKVIDQVIEKGVFRVEFLNRFDGVIFFKPLNDGELRSVTKLILQKLSRRLDKEKNIEVTFGDSVVESIIASGYNPMFGARSLNRYVEHTVEDLIARKIIEGGVKRGERISVEL